MYYAILNKEKYTKVDFVKFNDCINDISYILTFDKFKSIVGLRENSFLYINRKNIKDITNLFSIKSKLL